MIPEFNLISPGMADRMKSIGITKKSAMWWCAQNKANRWVLKPAAIIGQTFLRAYSLAELGEMIPWGFFQAEPVQKMPGGIWQVAMQNGTIKSHSLEVEARAEYLIDLIKSGQVNVVEINHPDFYNDPVNFPKKKKAKA